MKRPSKRTWELIQGLHRGGSFWEKLTGHHVSPSQAFDEISSSGEALVIPQLTNFLFDKRDEIRKAAAQTIGQLVSSLTSADLVQLDRAFRSHDRFSPIDAWDHQKPKDLKEFSQFSNAVIVMGMASFHRSGYMREAAVRELDKIVNGSELPFLLLRLNDWVDEIRNSATTAVLGRIRQDYAVHFLRHLRLVCRLASCGRSQHERILNAVTALFQEQTCAPLLRRGLQSRDRWVRRECFRMVLAAKTSSSTNLLKEVLSDADPIVRLWAARDLLTSLDDAELNRLLPLLIKDRFMPIRCEALNIWARRFPNDCRNALESALLDRSLSVRSLARHWIRTRDPLFHFASFYRLSLTKCSATQQRSAILGLGETGNIGDADAALPFLNASLISNRKAAIRTLAALDGDRFINQILTALTDAHQGISNEATRAFLARKPNLTEQFRTLFRTETRLHTRRNLFKILIHQSLWPHGIFLFETLRDKDDHIVELGQLAIRDWLMDTRRMATPPSADEAKQLRDAVKASSRMFTSSELREFEFCFKTFE